MLLETLLITACIHGSASSCTNSAQAYYEHNNLDKFTKQVEQQTKKEYPGLYYSVYYSGMVAYAYKEKTFTVPIYSHTFGEINFENKRETGLIVFKKGF